MLNQMIKFELIFSVALIIFGSLFLVVLLLLSLRYDNYHVTIFVSLKFITNSLDGIFYSFRDRILLR